MRLTDGDPRAFTTWTIFNGTAKDFFDFARTDRVAEDVWLLGPGVDVVTDVHEWMLPRTRNSQSLWILTPLLFRDAQRAGPRARRRGACRGLHAP